MWLFMVGGQLLPSHGGTKGCLCQAWLIQFLLMSYLGPLPRVRVTEKGAWGWGVGGLTDFLCVCLPPLSKHTPSLATWGGPP